MVDVEYRSKKNSHSAGIKQSSVRGYLGPTNTSATRKVCFSFAAYARNVIDHLGKFQISISKGLSDEEFSDVEREFGFTFPPDLKSILQEGLPVGVGFPNWRSGSKQQLSMLLNSPADGLCSEITRGRLWLTQWGPKPADTGEAVHIARRALKNAPPLVPICSHCYIPSSPNQAGNPVFLIYEKDVFYCGYDLANFFEEEAFVPRNCNLESEFWTSDIDDEGNAHSSIEEERSWECNPIRDVEMKSVDNGETIIQTRRKRLAGNDTNPQLSTPTFPAEESHANTFVPRKRFERGFRFSNQNIHDASRIESVARMSKENDFLGRKSACGAPLHPLEKPETRVRSAENSPRLGRFTVSRYTYFHKNPLPKKVLSQFSIAAPPWAAKTARHIEFWSDLVENQSIWDADAPPPQEKNHHPAFSGDVDHARPSDENHAESKDMVRPPHKPSRSGKRWLSVYFSDMAKRLRKGGWTEDEIAEMVEAALPGEQDIIMAHQLDVLSACLRKAGWSAEDVVEALDSDLAPCKLKRAGFMAATHQPASRRRQQTLAHSPPNHPSSSGQSKR